MSIRPGRRLLSSLLLLSLWSPAALAAGRSNFDAFLQQQGRRALPASASAQAEAQGLQILHTEPRLGVPTFVRASSPSVGVATHVLTTDGAAREHLRGSAALYRLRSTDVGTAVLKSVHDTGRGPVVVKYGQSLDGVEVFRSEASVVMNAGLELVALSGYLLPTELPRRGSFQLTASDAAARAFKDVTGEALGASGFVAGAALPGGYASLQLGSHASASSAHALESARAKKVYYPVGDALEPAYYVELSAARKGSADSEYMAYVYSAVDGRILMRNSLTADDSFSYRTFAEPQGAAESALFPYEGPQGWAATPHPTGTPDGYQAPWAAPNLVTLQNYPYSKNDPWLPAGSTQTRGNNVDAYADVGAPDGFQGDVDVRAVVSAPGVFDYTYDVNRAPGSSANQRMASVTNLFYVNNFLHDWFYDAGFDEAAGNAQQNNYGRGGVEGDPIHAQAQDYTGRGNANMSTPADGAKPRMQMYVFNGVPELKVLAPTGMTGPKVTESANFGAQSFEHVGSVKLLATALDQPTLGCAAFAAGTYAGKVALIDRGGCDFVVKAKNAQVAGATAVIIANNVPDEGARGMSGTDATVTVPVLGVSYELAAAWKLAVAADAGTDLRVSMRRTADLDRDGTIDNGIVAHEWGHYLSNRLIGDGNGLINNQGRSMGEGWSDVIAMLMVTRESDRNLPGNSDYEGVYSLAGYVTSGGANDGYYFGIRRVPYSTDFAKNALTFKHIQAGVPLPDSHPVNGPSDGGMNAEVHYSGEVWATMLWDCYVSLLNAHPFAEAQERMKAYLVAAYKATPVSPTMLEARDALLAVTAASDAGDHQRFVQAFARRGAGMGAKGPDRDSGDHLGVVESYEAGNNLEVVSIQLDDAIAGCDKDGVLDEGETGRLTVTVRNSGLGALGAFHGNVSVSSTSTLTLGSGGALSFSMLAPGETTSASIPVTLDAVSIPPPATLATASLAIAFDEPTLPTSARSATWDARLDYDDVAGVSATDSMDSPLSMWTSSAVEGVEVWRRESAGNRSVFHARNLPVTSDVTLTSPWLTVKATGSLEVVVTHRYSFESYLGFAPWYDGAVMEASLDGVYWYDVFSDLGAPLQDGLNYDASYFIGSNGSDNPLMYRTGFVGMSAGFPAFGVTRVGLGSLLAGRPMQLRFRIGTDGGVGAYGWDIDSVEFKNVLETPFSAQVPEAAGSGGGARVCNTRPVARVGADQEVSEYLPDSDTRRTVQLDGSGSSDAEGQLLSYQWRQVGGPAVTLSSTTAPRPTFVADVPADSIFAFELTVSDGTDVSAPKLSSVKVLNRNRPPVAVVPASLVVDEGALVTLDGSASYDPDGEAITYRWTQMRETSAIPLVTLSSYSSNKPTFTAPEVAQDTTLKFVMQVEDGYWWSLQTFVTVVVRNVDRAPVVEAGNPVSVRSGQTVKLTGTASDPDGGLLGYAWTQHAGELPVTMTGASTKSLSFTAPPVSSETLLHFDLTVTSGGVSVKDTVEVTVKPANQAPVAQAPAVPDATSGATVTLAGQGTDADGDTLTYAWTQVGGPTVTLVGADTATPHFAAPEVTSQAQLVFQLVVRDGALSSAPVSLTVTVGPRPVEPPVATASGCSTSGSGSPLIALALLALGMGLRRRSVGEAAP